MFAISIALTSAGSANVRGEGPAPTVYHIDFGPDTIAPAPGYARDAGLSFDGARGFGWLAGSAVAPSRARSCEGTDTRQETFILSRRPRIWELSLENGDYDVTVSVGDCLYGQGAHRVVAEGVPLVDDGFTTGGSFLVPGRRVRVLDGRLTLAIGSDQGFTTLNSIDVARSADQPGLLHAINFQPGSAQAPPGFVADVGDPYNATTGRGWDRRMVPFGRERDASDNQVLDTLIYSRTGETATYQVTVPVGSYEVEFGYGDVAYSQDAHRISLEGRRVVDDATTSAGEVVALRSRMAIDDGAVTLDIGGTAGNTVVEYLSVAAATDFLRRVSFQPRTAEVPAGYEADWGSPYDSIRGFGWARSQGGNTRDREVHTDQHLDTLLFVAGSVELWEMAVPAGQYEVRLTLGDAAYSQGPHAASVEGRALVTGELTATGEFLVRVARLSVTDGFLSVAVGSTAPGVTTINAIEVAQIDHVEAISFQPEDAPAPEGFRIDAGRRYEAARGYGWDDDFLFDRGRTRDREVVAAQTVDTLIYTSSPAEAWRLDLENGDYLVTTTVGDAAWSQGPHRVEIEGLPVFDGETTPAGGFLSESVCVTIDDGLLDLSFGGSAGISTLNYLTVDASHCGPPCGNGILDPDEACDDGNTDGGDGCSPHCSVEPGWECQGAPSQCTLLCGEPVESLPAQFEGDTTGAENSVRDIPLACNGNYSTVQGPDHVYRFTVETAAELTFTLSTSSTTYDPSIYVLGECADGQSCIQGADNCFATELFPPAGCVDATESLQLSFDPGTYYFYVDSFYSGATPLRAQGPYRLDISAIEAELISFEVD